MRYCGYSEYFHDSGLAFVTEEGDIEFACHGERYTQKKFDPNLPEELYDLIRDDDHVTFYEDHNIRKATPWHKGNYENLEYRKDWVRRMRYGGTTAAPIFDALVYDDCISHHHSHAAMAYYTRPWESTEDTVILTCDGQGEAQTYGLYDHNFNLIHYWNHPKSIGQFYTNVTKIMGLRSMEDEYVVMGLSAYGENTHGDQIIEHFKEMPGHDPNSPHAMSQVDRRLGVRSYKWLQKIHAKIGDEDMAASIQAFAEWAIIDRAKFARQYGSKLCYGGGVAQNIVANSLIKDMFDDIWIAPSPTDAGSALGAAAHSYAQATGKTRVNWKDSFLGYSIDREINPKEVVDHLIEHRYCGIANGPAEYGPRALGNRSLIADVRYDVKDTVNAIKRRQEYRPFAPAILEEFVDDYFDGPTNEYMQYQSMAKHDYKSVTHVDGTARVQVVRKNHNSILRPIIEEYYERTGVPMLLNTSLNIRGKPMVNDEKHAANWEREYGVKVF